MIFALIRVFVLTLVCDNIGLFVTTPFATRTISSKPRVLTKFCLWQTVLPQHFATKKIVKISSKNCPHFVKFELTQRNLWRNVNDFFSSKSVAKGVAKGIATSIATKSSTNFQRNLNESKIEYSWTNWRYTKPIANHEQ